MRRIRIVPILLVENGKLVKSIRFKKKVYIGDPLNAVKIFNDKEVDEIVVLDISATSTGKEPSYDFIEQFAGECFMPMGYGGGIRTLEEAKKVFSKGAEKIVLNSGVSNNTDLITEIASVYGSQSVVISIDVRKNLWGQYVAYSHSGTKRLNLKLADWIKLIEQKGAGEIFINSIDQDGMMKGYDLDLIKFVSESTSLPVMACGGAGNIEDFEKAVNIGKASAAAAGSMFVFNGNLKGVLISYPSQKELIDRVFSKI